MSQISTLANKFRTFDLLKLISLNIKNKDGFSGLDLLSIKEGQRSRSKGYLLVEEVYPIKQLTKYGSDPIRDNEKKSSVTERLT